MIPSKRFFIFLTFCIAFYSTSSVSAQDVSKQFEGFNLEGYTLEGDKDWDITGDSADITNNPIEIINIDANKYGDQEMNLKAQRGSYDKLTGQVYLEKDVVITSKEGSQLRTDSLAWNKEENIVSTDDRVELTDLRMKASGTGLNANVELKEAEFKKDVSVEMNTKPEDGSGQILTITCSGTMVVDQLKSIAVFQDDVKAVQSDRVLTSDKMEIFFDPENQIITKMLCLGNVTIVQGENSSHSDSAIYTAKNQKLKLLGRPKLILNMDGENDIFSIDE